MGFELKRQRASREVKDSGNKSNAAPLARQKNETDKTGLHGLSCPGRPAPQHPGLGPLRLKRRVTLPSRRDATHKTPAGGGL